MKRENIRKQLRDLLSEGPRDQDELVSEIKARDDKILLTIRKLLREGKLSYNLDGDISGRGKTYETGLTETD